MSKWMDNWLYERDKRNIEKELDQCFRGLMELCMEIMNKYKDIPQSAIQEYLNCECTQEITLQAIRKYPKFKEDIASYLKKKEDFFSFCEALDMLDFEWNDDFDSDGYHINIDGCRMNMFTGEEENK